VQGGDFQMATSGSLHMANRGYFFMATDTSPHSSNSPTPTPIIEVLRSAGKFASMVELLALQLTKNLGERRH
jgi:hypothetical protein